MLNEHDEADSTALDALLEIRNDLGGVQNIRYVSDSFSAWHYFGMVSWRIIFSEESPCSGVFRCRKTGKSKSYSAPEFGRRSQFITRSTPMNLNFTSRYTFVQVYKKHPKRQTISGCGSGDNFLP